MTTLEDSELLRRYATDRSEAAFGELVRRHLTPVYAFALRRVGGDAHLAEDVTQMVFAALARKAASLTGRQTLGGWLCRTTHFAARDVVRVERRRRAREQEAQIMDESPANPVANIDWEKLQPVLTDTMGELNDDDRDAVWLRFFEGRSFAEVGARLRLTENAARMRVERALDKLHGLLAQRGVTSTTAALGLALAGQATVAAPAGLAASITGVALAGTAVGSAGWLTIFMGMSKLHIGVAGAFAVAGGVGYFVQAETNAGLRREIATLRDQQSNVAALRAENRQLAATAVEIETLRRDDAELQRLAQHGAEAKKALEENARRVAEANARAEVRRIDEQTVRAEIDRMNREGNALVVEYKAIAEKSKDPSLAAEAKAAALASADQKMAEIRAKQNEIKAYKEHYRDLLPVAERPAQKVVVPTTPEIDELNRVGNVLVAEYQSLVASAKDAALTVEARAAAESAAKEKLEAIRAKQNEVRALQASHGLLTARQPTNPMPDQGADQIRAVQKGGSYEFRRKAPNEDEAATQSPPATADGSPK